MRTDQKKAIPGEPGSKNSLSKIPVIACLAVFLPIIMTKLFYTVPALNCWSISASESYPMMNFLVYILMNWVIVLAGYLILRHKNISLKDIGFGRFRISDLLWGFIAVIIGFLVYYAALFFSKIMGLPPMKGMGYSLSGPVNILSAILVTSIFGPLAEDILFRGFLLSHLATKIRKKLLVGLIGVLMFTVIHIFYFGWSGALFILLWSPLSVGLFMWRKTIYASLILHVLNNIFAYVIVPLVFRS